MTPQFSTSTLFSVYAWLDNAILENGHAFTNTTSRFYYTPDPRLGTGFVAYQSPFKSFVWDSGVEGATIFNTISGSFGTLSRGQSGMKTDFINGRVILPASFGTNAIVSGSYAFKDFNVYFANQTQEAMIFSSKYYLNSRFSNTGRPPAYDFVTPCIFVTNSSSVNDNFALGGIYNTVQHISLNVLAENLSQLEGALSILTDSKHVYLPQLGEAFWPLNEYGDYKVSGYNYDIVSQQYGNPGNLYFVSSVKASKVSDYAKIDQSIFLGMVNITVEKVRQIF